MTLRTARLAGRSRERYLDGSAGVPPAAPRIRNDDQLKRPSICVDRDDRSWLQATLKNLPRRGTHDYLIVLATLIPKRTRMSTGLCPPSLRIDGSSRHRHPTRPRLRTKRRS